MAKKVDIKSIAERKQSFDKYLNKPDFWVLKGDELLISVKFLSMHCSFYTGSWKKRGKEDIGKELPDEDRTFSTVQMLKAMALECYFKSSLAQVWQYSFKMFRRIWENSKYEGTRFAYSCKYDSREQ